VAPYPHRTNVRQLRGHRLRFLVARPNLVVKLLFIIITVVFSKAVFAATPLSLNTHALIGAAARTSLNGDTTTASTPRVVSLTATPTSLTFGPVAVGVSQTKPVALLNSGSTALTITQVSLNGSSFSTPGLVLPIKLSAGQNIPINVTFAAQTTASVNGTMSVTATGSTRGGKGWKSSSGVTTASVALSGSGTSQGQLGVSPASLNFGGVQVGSTQTLPVQVTNAGGTSFTLSQANVSGSGYTVQGLVLPLTLAAGQTAGFSVKFTPQAAGSVSGSVGLVSDAVNSNVSIPLTGSGLTAGSLSASPSSLTFGNVQISTNKKLTTTISNTGGTSVTISQATVSGGGMSVSGLTLPLTLAAGQTATATVTFAPASGGSVSGNLVITSNGSNPTLAIPVSGVGTTAGTLAASPASLAFGNVQTGTNASLSETVTNTGGMNVTITQAATSGGAYSLSGLTLPKTLAPGQGVTFTVKCSPTVSGYTNGTVTVVSDASNPSLSIPASGTAVSAGVLAANPTSVNFGNVAVGSNARATVTLSNSGGSSVTVSQLTTTGTGLSFSGVALPLTLSAGQTTAFTVTFVPQTTGTLSGNVSVVSNASNTTLNIPVSGSGVSGGTLSANPTSINFGSVAVGSTKSQNEVLTNSGGSNLTLSTVAATGSGYNIIGPTLPLTLSAGQSATFSVVFSPVDSGSSAGSLTITTDVSSLNVPLSGSGTAQGQLAVNPTSLSFGSTVVGLSTTKSVTLSATGASVTVSSASSTSSEYTITGLTFPFTIESGTSKTFNVNFAPKATGTASGTISVTSNAMNTPLALSVSGTGAAPPQHSVTLSWNPSTSVVAGYNVYRGSVSGGPYTRVGSATIATPAYTDDTVQAGSSYYYVVTAINDSGIESFYSNQVQAVIPSP
jgi:hypothetical protein